MEQVQRFISGGVFFVLFWQRSGLFYVLFFVSLVFLFSQFRFANEFCFCFCCCCLGIHPFYFRPDITALVDWAYNSKLPTYLPFILSKIRPGIVHTHAHARPLPPHPPAPSPTPSRPSSSRFFTHWHIHASHNYRLLVNCLFLLISFVSVDIETRHASDSNGTSKYEDVIYQQLFLRFWIGPMLHIYVFHWLVLLSCSFPGWPCFCCCYLRLFCLNI